MRGTVPARRPGRPRSSNTPCSTGLMARQILLSDERHLDVQLVELARRSVGPPSVPETGCDLKYRSNPATIRSCLNCCGAWGAREHARRTRPARGSRALRGLEVNIGV
jgi:hypothetical protein